MGPKERYTPQPIDLTGPAGSVKRIVRHTNCTHGRVETTSPRINMQNTKHANGRTKGRDHKGSAPTREEIGGRG